MLVNIIIFCGMLTSTLSFFVLCAIYNLIQQQIKVKKAQAMAQLCSMLDSETLKKLLKD